MSNIEINTLVKHKILNLGIGCVSKVLKRSVKVNFGFSEVKTCNPKELDIIDVRQCSIISISEIRKNMTFSKVIIGNEVKKYVGIGWVSLNVVTENDLKLYPRLVSDEEFHRQRGKIHGKNFGL